MLVSMFSDANTIGLVGVVMVLYAYFMLQIGRMPQDSVRYSLINFIGSVFILFSLIFYWNLASVVIEIAWLLISLYGLIKGYKLRSAG